MAPKCPLQPILLGGRIRNHSVLQNVMAVWHTSILSVRVDFLQKSLSGSLSAVGYYLGLLLFEFEFAAKTRPKFLNLDVCCKLKLVVFFL